eukprot:6599661-Karenia_brevis.AAC.1
MQEEIRDGKVTQEVREKQNTVPFIWPEQYGGASNPGERMRVFDNFNQMEEAWKALPISELPGQFDYDMIAFVSSVQHDGKYGCVVGRVRANNKITGKINHDVRCYAKFDFCYARMAW